MLAGIVSSVVPQRAGRVSSAQCTSKAGSGFWSSGMTVMPSKPLQGLNQRRLHRKDHGRSLSAQQRQIAGKLDCVSEPLFGIDQDGLPGERLACPGGLRELAVKVLEPAVFLKFPAPLVFAPAGL